MQFIYLVLQIILGISVLLFIGSIIGLSILKNNLYKATYDFSKLLKNRYPQIRSSIGLKGPLSHIADSGINQLNFIDRLYIQPYRLVKSFGSKVEVERYYRSYVDIDAIILTKDTILIGKMEELFGLLQSMIRTLTVCFLLFFIGLTLPQGLLKLFGF